MPRRAVRVVLSVLAAGFSSATMLAETGEYMTPAEIIERTVSSEETNFTVALLESLDGALGTYHPEPRGANGQLLQFPTARAGEGGRLELAEYEFLPATEKAILAAEVDYRNKAYDKALRAYEKARRRDPDCYVLHSHIGDCHLFSGKPKKALKAYDRAVALNPNDANTHWYRARTLAQLGKYHESRQAFMKAVSLAPGNERILGSLESHKAKLEVDPQHVMFQPRSGAQQTGDGEMLIGIYREPEVHWLVYALCKAIWIIDDSHREKMTGSKKYRWSSHEELECVSALLATYEEYLSLGGEPDPYLDRVKAIAEDDMLDMFVIYEFGSKLSPHVMVAQGSSAQRRMLEFVSKHVVKSVRPN